MAYSGSDTTGTVTLSDGRILYLRECPDLLWQLVISLELPVGDPMGAEIFASILIDGMENDNNLPTFTTLNGLAVPGESGSYVASGPSYVPINVFETVLRHGVDESATYGNMYYSSLRFDSLVARLSLTPLQVPEPSTWLLMLSGLGLVGFGLHRARRA